MAAWCTNVVFGSVGCVFPSTPHGNGRLQASPSILCRCSWAQSCLCRSWGNISVRDSRGPSRGRLWDLQQQRRLTLQQQQPQTESPSSTSFCLPPANNVSSDASASTELNVMEGNESGMSIEEKNAIVAFEAGGWSSDEVDSEEERNSNEFLQLSSSEEEDEEEEPEALRATRKREQEVAELKRRASKAVKGQGASVANVVALFMVLLDRPSPGDGRMIAGAGSAVIERVEEEVAKLQGMEGVDGQILFEILRLVKLLQMDIQLVAAARKVSTLSERLVQAKAHCRQFLNILSML